MAGKMINMKIKENPKDLRPGSRVIVTIDEKSNISGYVMVVGSKDVLISVGGRGSQFKAMGQGGMVCSLTC